MSIAHGTAMFLGWHRIFLRLFEIDLQAADKKNKGDGKISLPFLNWSKIKGFEHADDIWKSDYLGGSGDANGFISKAQSKYFNEDDWKITGSIPFYNGALRRKLGEKLNGGNIYSWSQAKQDVLNLMTLPTFDRFPKNDNDFCHSLESGPHGSVHVYIGGFKTNDRNNDGRITRDEIQMYHLSHVPVSPNDPIFFFHHCNVDRVWSAWQAINTKKEKYLKFGHRPGSRYYDKIIPWNNAMIKDILQIKNLSSNALHSSTTSSKGYEYEYLEPAPARP